MKATFKRLLALCSFVIVTIAMMSFSQSFFYHIFPSSDQRYLTLMDVLDNTDQNVLIFGDSRGVMGIDAKIVKDDLHLSENVYNLSTFSQDIYLSSYFYGLIEDNTSLVIQCTSPAFFDKPESHQISVNKAIPMFLSGYRIDEDSKRLIGDCNDFLEQPEFESYFESREYFKNYITSTIRPLFDNEVYNESAVLDTRFPHIYTSDRSPNYPVQKTGCDKYVGDKKPIPQLNFLKKTKQYFEKMDVEYILVMMPINPDDCSHHARESEKLASIIRRETGIKVVNLTTLLEAKYFYDAVHANKAGAKIISNEIAERISKEHILPTLY